MSMANLESRRRENTEGEFFVDNTCISCAACWKEAPENFASHSIETYAYVAEQPRTPREREACFRALKICPVGAIGQQARGLKCAM